MEPGPEPGPKIGTGTKLQGPNIIVIGTGTDRQDQKWLVLVPVSGLVPVTVPARDISCLVGVIAMNGDQFLGSPLHSKAMVISLYYVQYFHLF